LTANAPQARIAGVPASAPRDSTLAVVGDGFGSLIVYSTAIYLGFKPEEITIYGPSDNPVGTYQQFAFNLGQTVLRSESESHFLPADWPTFAELDAWSHRSLAPLVRSTRRKYNPGVSEILTEAGVVQKRLNWNGSRVPVRVGWLQREEDPAHFVLYDEDANFIGRSKHVMLALGHGPLSFPATLAKAKASDPEIDDRIVQAYQAKSYHPDGRYIVLGAGIASINEWANALDVGAKCIALRRNPAPEEQDLNVPRCLFESLGIDAFAGLSFEQRVQFLGNVLKGTTPRRRSWLERIEKGRREGRFEELLGEIDTVERGPAGLRVHVSSRFAEDPGWLDVTGVVAGTGFNKSVLTLPLLRRLIEHYDLPVQEGRLKLRTNCGVPGLDREDSRLCMMGLTANNVIPHGDTIAGLKYIGRRFVADVARAENLKRRPFLGRLGMQISLSRETATALRQVRSTEQLA
jgi:hypothetical protein